LGDIKLNGKSSFFVVSTKIFAFFILTKEEKSGVYSKGVYTVKLNTFCFFSISIKYIVIVLMSAFTSEATNELNHLKPASQFIVHLLFCLESFVVLKHLK